jgi:hypothetical protein
MASQPQIETFTGTRITIKTPNSFTTTMQRLYSEIGTPNNLTWPSLAASITSYTPAAKSAFIAATEKAVGSKGFMIFLVPSLPFPPFPNQNQKNKNR